MEKLHVLGTGNAMATRVYNTCFVIENQQGLFMVDTGGGNGILRQMELAGLDFSKVSDIMITHAHSDHLNGMVWVLRKILSGPVDPLRSNLSVWCHESVQKGIMTICELMLTGKLVHALKERVRFHFISDGMEAMICGYPVRFMDIHSSKLLQFGFTAQFSSGTRLACLGDEPINEDCREQVAGSQWILSEAFCLLEDAERFKPYEKHHSTAADAAKLAGELQAENLVLWHTEDQTISTRKEKYTA